MCSKQNQKKHRRIPGSSLIRSTGLCIRVRHFIHIAQQLKSESEFKSKVGGLLTQSVKLTALDREVRVSSESEAGLSTFTAEVEDAPLMWRWG